jgi:hypothetical protein
VSNIFLPFGSFGISGIDFGTRRAEDAFFEKKSKKYSFIVISSLVSDLK